MANGNGISTLGALCHKQSFAKASEYTCARCPLWVRGYLILIRIPRRTELTVCHSPVLPWK